jgi:hypothetical protein
MSIIPSLEFQPLCTVTPIPKATIPWVESSYCIHQKTSKTETGPAGEGTFV